MPTITRAEALAECVTSAQRTGVAADESLASVAMRDRDREGWQHAIDTCLIEWGRNPSAVQDEGIQPPTANSLSRACELATAMRNAAEPRPLRVVPDGEGGVVFERRAGELFERLEVDSDGKIEYAILKNFQLVYRGQI